MSDESRGVRLSLKGSAGLVIAVAVVVILLITRPAYRWLLLISWFFLISVAIGLGVAAILYLWHRYKPIEDKDVENKRPLGLD